MLSLNVRARPVRGPVIPRERRYGGRRGWAAAGAWAAPRSAMGGRIECVFFSEFHPTLGPKITYQVRGEVLGARSACPRPRGWDWAVAAATEGKGARGQGWWLRPGEGTGLGWNGACCAAAGPRGLHLPGAV